MRRFRRISASESLQLNFICVWLGRAGIKIGGRHPDVGDVVSKAAVGLVWVHDPHVNRYVDGCIGLWSRLGARPSRQQVCRWVDWSRLGARPSRQQVCRWVDWSVVKSFVTAPEA